MQVTSLQQHNSSDFSEHPSAKMLKISYNNCKDQQRASASITNGQQKRTCLHSFLNIHEQEQNLKEVELTNELKRLIRKLQTKNKSGKLLEEEQKSIKQTVYTDIKNILLSLKQELSGKFNFLAYHLISNKLICPSPSTDTIVSCNNHRAQLQKNELINKITYLMRKRDSKEKQLSKLAKDQYQLSFFLQSSKESISCLKKEIQDLRKSCQEKLSTKSTFQKQLSKMRKKKHELIESLKHHKKVIFDQIAQKNEINHHIQKLRDQYQKIQSQNFQLDAKNQNIRRYGSESIPPQLTLLKQKKEELKQDLGYLKKEYEYQKQSIQFLIPKNVLSNLQKKLDHLISKRDKMNNYIKKSSELLIENRQLQQQVNQRETALNNSQLSNLTISLSKEEKIIYQNQKQLSNLKKKLAALSNQIQSPKIHHISEKKGKGATNLKNKKTKQVQIERQVPPPTHQTHCHSIYEQIKKDLQQLKIPKDCPTCSKNHKNKAKKSKHESGQFIEGRIELSATTFRIQQKKNWLVFVLIIFVLLLSSGLCHKIYRK